MIAMISGKRSKTKWLLAFICANVLCGAIVFTVSGLGGGAGLLAFLGGTTMVALVCCLLVNSVIRPEDWLEDYGRFCVLMPVLIGLVSGVWACIRIQITGSADAFGVLAILGTATYAFLASCFAGVAFSVMRCCWRSDERLAGWQCQCCGYRIDNLPGPRCPECGTQFVYGSGEADRKTG